MQLHWQGILIGAAAFLMIGAFHPLVIWCEYRFSKRIWPVFLIAGIVFLAAALFSGGIAGALLGVLGFTCLWSIRELSEQEERVKKGWFPRNPKRKHP